MGEYRVILDGEHVYTARNMIQLQEFIAELDSDLPYTIQHVQEYTVAANGDLIPV